MRTGAVPGRDTPAPPATPARSQVLNDIPRCSARDAPRSVTRVTSRDPPAPIGQCPWPPLGHHGAGPVSPHGPDPNAELLPGPETVKLMRREWLDLRCEAMPSRAASARRSPQVWILLLSSIAMASFRSIIDFLTLVKLQGRWQIVSKAFHFDVRQARAD